MLQQLLRRTNHNSTAMLQHDAFVKAGAGHEEAIVASPQLLLSSITRGFLSNHFDNMSNNGPRRDRCRLSWLDKRHFHCGRNNCQMSPDQTWANKNSTSSTKSSQLTEKVSQASRLKCDFAHFPSSGVLSEQIGFSSQATIMQTRKQRVPAIGPHTDSHICNAIADVTRIRDLGDDMLGQPFTSCIGHKSLSTCIVPHQATAEHATGSSKMLWSAAWVSIADGHHGRSHIDKRPWSIYQYAPQLKLDTNWQPVIVKAAREMDFYNREESAIETAKWHLRGDGASLASSRPVPNDKLRKQDAKKSVFLSREEASTYSLDVDKQELWLKAGMIPPRRLPQGGDASDIMEAKDRFPRLLLLVVTSRQAAESADKERRDHDDSTAGQSREETDCTIELSYTIQLLHSNKYGPALAAAIAKMEGRAIDERMAYCVETPWLLVHPESPYAIGSTAKNEIMGSKKTPHS
ncbi:hypothetical protein CCUS01_14453 [Colletotrichum cuscutae]|uniref:Uncharacterized protein n=1 Tax=Colletotrichum cuscutae TaxID=1209917 RepID=A0AAI9Y938_9PEZI|nr:hypothetical protein CCUS01_14453 [Colletotrichum cuscutae]